MKKYIFVAISSLLVLLWIAFIWYNSMQPADKSIELSSGLTDRLNVVINEIAEAVTKPPATTVPVTTAPVTTAPVTTVPADSDTVTTTEPVTTEPVTTAPATTEPILKERVVRKGAHFLEYMLLGVLSAVDAIFIAYAISRRSAIFVSLSMLGTSLLSFAVALVDEFVIQAKTDGRGPSWRDVGIDSAGAFAGIMLCMMIFLITYIIANRCRSDSESRI